MSKNRIIFLFAVIVFTFAFFGCSGLNNSANQTGASANSNSNAARSNNSQTLANKNTVIADDESASTSGAEKVKPAAGKGNVQGKVLYNDKPVEGIEIKICGEFSSIMGVECGGKTKTTKTDADGVFVVADLDPMTYQGLTAKVFKTDYYIFPQEGIMTPQKFNVEADKTIFARDINLFRSDLKLTNPKAGSKVEAKDVMIKWDAYADATYYKVSLFAANPKSQASIYSERVEDTTYKPLKTLINDTYRISVEAYNSNDHKLSQSSDDIKFTVTGGENPPAE
jgi:hypothetical protein